MRPVLASHNTSAVSHTRYAICTVARCFESRFPIDRFRASLTTHFCLAGTSTLRRHKWLSDGSNSPARPATKKASPLHQRLSTDGVRGGALLRSAFLAILPRRAAAGRSMLILTFTHRALPKLRPAPRGFARARDIYLLVQSRFLDSL
jgi:hypothetical protein